jgi:hypothetical protein
MKMTKVGLLQDGMALESDAPSGASLTGPYQDDGRLLLGVIAGTEDEFLVFQAASGKLVVYQVDSPHDSLSTGVLIRSTPWRPTFLPSYSKEAAIRASTSPTNTRKVGLDEAD